MSIAGGNNVHFVLYRYCCNGRYFVNIHLRCREKVGVFDNDCRVAILKGTKGGCSSSVLLDCSVKHLVLMMRQLIYLVFRLYGVQYHRPMLLGSGFVVML